VRTGHNRHVSYLTSQISELTVEDRGVLPHISFGTDVETQVVRGETRRQPTGATLELLNELHDTRELKLDSTMLAGKMDDLSNNLHDLDLWGEAFEASDEFPRPHLPWGLFIPAKLRKIMGEGTKSTNKM
jgi:hypothetical protein